MIYYSYGISDPKETSVAPACPETGTRTHDTRPQCGARAWETRYRAAHLAPCFFQGSPAPFPDTLTQRIDRHMARALFSPAARNDLLEIWAHLAEYSPGTADAWIARIVETADVLASFPYLGRVRMELSGSPRSIAIESFALFYEVKPRSIRVLRVLHSSRDIPSLFLDAE